MSQTKVKICGIKDIDALQSCISAGANFIGFVFYPPSPRAIDIEQLESLSSIVPKDIKKVGLFVNPTDALLSQAAPHLDIIQLHGAETPIRCEEIKTLTQKSVMKAIAVASASDLTQLHLYEAVCEWILFDAKPLDKNNTLPGGNGLTFDWELLKNINIQKPWMLAGGLNDENVETAISLLQPIAVDVSSGVESAPGIKNHQKISSFIRTCHKA